MLSYGLLIVLFFGVNGNPPESSNQTIIDLMVTEFQNMRDIVNETGTDHLSMILNRGQENLLKPKNQTSLKEQILSILTIINPNFGNILEPIKETTSAEELLSFIDEMVPEFKIKHSSIKETNFQEQFLTILTNYITKYLNLSRPIKEMNETLSKEVLDLRAKCDEQPHISRLHNATQMLEYEKLNTMYHILDYELSKEQLKSKIDQLQADIYVLNTSTANK